MKRARLHDHNALGGGSIVINLKHGSLKETLNMTTNANVDDLMATIMIAFRLATCRLIGLKLKSGGPVQYSIPGTTALPFSTVSMMKDCATDRLIIVIGTTHETLSTEVLVQAKAIESLLLETEEPTGHIRRSRELQLLITKMGNDTKHLLHQSSSLKNLIPTFTNEERCEVAAYLALTQDYQTLTDYPDLLRHDDISMENKEVKQPIQRGGGGVTTERAWCDFPRLLRLALWGSAIAPNPRTYRNTVEVVMRFAKQHKKVLEHNDVASMREQETRYIRAAIRSTHLDLVQDALEKFYPCIKQEFLRFQITPVDAHDPETHGNAFILFWDELMRLAVHTGSLPITKWLEKRAMSEIPGWRWRLVAHLNEAIHCGYTEHFKHIMKAWSESANTHHTNSIMGMTHLIDLNPLFTALTSLMIKGPREQRLGTQYTGDVLNQSRQTRTAEVPSNWLAKYGNNWTVRGYENYDRIKLVEMLSLKMIHHSMIIPGTNEENEDNELCSRPEHYSCWNVYKDIVQQLITPICNMGMLGHLFDNLLESTTHYCSRDSLNFSLVSDAFDRCFLQLMVLGLNPFDAANNYQNESGILRRLISLGQSSAFEMCITEQKRLIVKEYGNMESKNWLYLPHFNLSILEETRPQYYEHLPVDDDTDNDLDDDQDDEGLGDLIQKDSKVRRRALQNQSLQDVHTISKWSTVDIASFWNWVNSTLGRDIIKSAADRKDVKLQTLMQYKHSLATVDARFPLALFHSHHNFRKPVALHVPVEAHKPRLGIEMILHICLRVNPIFFDALNYATTSDWDQLDARVRSGSTMNNLTSTHLRAPLIIVPEDVLCRINRAVSMSKVLLRHGALPLLNVATLRINQIRTLLRSMYEVQCSGHTIKVGDISEAFRTRVILQLITSYLEDVSGTTTVALGVDNFSSEKENKEQHNRSIRERQLVKPHVPTKLWESIFRDFVVE